MNLFSAVSLPCVWTEIPVCLYGEYKVNFKNTILIIKFTNLVHATKINGTSYNKRVICETSEWLATLSVTTEQYSALKENYN